MDQTSANRLPECREDPAALPPYEPPRVITFRGQEVLEEIGPAQACSFLHSVVLCS